MYLDYTSSGAKNVAHVHENQRLVVMFCAFDGSPKIVRLHGNASVITPEHARYSEMTQVFPPHIGTRAFIHLAVNRVSDSCGYSVPFYNFQEHRDILDKWCENKGAEKVPEYRIQKNQHSIDGLPAFSDN